LRIAVKQELQRKVMQESRQFNALRVKLMLCRRSRAARVLTIEV